MKKILIFLISSCMLFFLIGAFYTKMTGRTEIGFSRVFTEFQNARLGFDIKNDIEELQESMNNLDTNTSFGGDDVFSKVSSIAKNIYYVLRFGIKLIFHSLVAVLNICICVLRIIGFDLSYIHFNRRGSGLGWSVVPSGIPHTSH